MDKNAPVFIAVPTNDGRTIFPKMLGMAKYICIYSGSSKAKTDITY